MVGTRVSRRKLAASLLTLPLLSAPVHANDVIALGWEDLLPQGQDKSFTEILVNVVREELASLARLQAPSTGVRNDWNGKRISLPGFMVPITYDGTGVSEFILVPYVGACIHVPPPPANQLVLVSSPKPHQLNGLFESVLVTGALEVSELSTDLADIGYALEAEKIQPFE